MFNRQQVLKFFENPSSTWKERADRDIKKYRMGDASVKFTDKSGKPLENVSIKVSQKNHAFRFGGNIFMLDEMESEEKNEIYKEKFANLFNMATLPFYWCDLEPERGKTRYTLDSPKIYRRPNIDLCIEFCEKHGIEPREHALAYEHFFPEWLYDASSEEIKEALENRMKEIAERYKDKINTIEVTNEMLWDEGRTKFYTDPDYVQWCFDTARKYFPNNNLSINEYSLFDGRYYAYLDEILKNDIPIDSIGIQYHVFCGRIIDEIFNLTTRYNPEAIYDGLDKFKNFNKPLQITEVTVPAHSNDPEDEEIQAKILEYLYTIWFSHPNMEQIIYWNLPDGYAAFAPQGDMTSGENVYYGGLLRFDMSEKPAYKKLYELIHKTWHTEKELNTDKNGCAEFNGFYGEYEITVDGKKLEQTISVTSGKDNTFVIEV